MSDKNHVIAFTLPAHLLNKNAATISVNGQVQSIPATATPTGYKVEGQVTINGVTVSANCTFTL